MSRASWLPRVTQTVRFRLTLLYSTVLFGLTAIVLAGTYVALSLSVGDEPVSRTVDGVLGVIVPGRGFTPLRNVQVTVVKDIEQAINAQTLDALRIYSLWALAGLFVVSLGVGWVLSGRALRPVRQIAQAAGSIGAGDLSQRIRLSGPDDEFAELAGTLDAMLARLDEAFDAQRRLLDDASHELRTPLAIISANVDSFLLAEGTSEADRQQAVVAVSRAARRMERLVEDLLAAARRDAPAFSDGPVDLRTIVEEAGREYEVVAGERGQRIACVRGEADGPVVVVGDHDALRRAVSNLLSNAVRYTPDGGSVTVASGRQGDWCWLAVSDTGPGIAPALQAQVFDRFWRGEGGGSPGHAGLGLAIVRQIAEGHGGRVSLHSPGSAGATFVLWLPAGGGAAGPAPMTDPLALPAGSG